MHLRKEIFITWGPFTVYSDHKPIVSIFNKPGTISPLRNF